MPLSRHKLEFLLLSSSGSISELTNWFKNQVSLETEGLPKKSSPKINIFEMDLEKISRKYLHTITHNSGDRTVMTTDANYRLHAKT